MGAGAVTVNGHHEGFWQFVDPSRTWYNNRRIIALNGWIVLLLITSSNNGYDGSMMNTLQAESQWKDYFNNPQGGKLGLLNAIQNIGALAGYPFAPYLSDGIGRRPTVAFGALIMCVAVAIQTAAHSTGMFIGARFLIGFGLTFAANAAPMLVTEISYPVYRAPLTSLYNSLWYSGAIVAAWTTFGTEYINNTWAWRIPSLFQGIPAILQVCLIWFLPESPRFLVSKGRDVQAIKTLAYYHADGNEDDPLVQFEYQEIKAQIDFDKAVASKVGYKSLFTSPGNRRRMAIIIPIAFFSQWSGNGLISYYLTKILTSIGITNTTIQLLINGILQIWNLAWACGASFAVERAGRRLLFISSVVGMLTFFIFWTICSAIFAENGNTQAAHAVIAFIFLFYAAYDLAFTPLIVSYTVEILPYSVRAKGFNIFNFTISVALIFNQYVNPIALEAINWKYYIVYIAWLCFELAYVYFTIIETKGLSLEETAALFDGAGKRDEMAANAAVASKVAPPSPINEKDSAEFPEHSEHLDA
ncbi:hexose transporter [Dentipellis sp. KUC8613]|nr:hexose transporter [Dentipellis sp. KUC8613]